MSKRKNAKPKSKRTSTKPKHVRELFRFDISDAIEERAIAISSPEHFRAYLRKQYDNADVLMLPGDDPVVNRRAIADDL